jgi:hypothetical protein
MDFYDQVASAIKALTPLGRAGMPEDIGLIAAFSPPTKPGGSLERSSSAPVASDIAPQQAFGHQRPRRISSGRNRQIYQ